MSDLGAEAKSAARRRGLGMGLSALLGGGAESLAAAQGEGPRTLPIEFLRPSPLQPRRRFDDEDLDALVESVRTKGVIQPLLVRRPVDGGDGFEIVAGERRWRAAQRAGLHELPVVVCQLSDRETLEVALLENVQRQDLTPLEEADGYRRLIEEFGHTQEALASVVGKSRSHVANMLRLHGLPGPVRDLVERGALSAGHARALLGVRDPVALAKIVVGRGLNVRQTEDLVRSDTGRAHEAVAAKSRDPDTVALERDLSHRLGLRVRLSARGRGGTLSIAYRSLDQLDGLLQKLR